MNINLAKPYGVNCSPPLNKAIVFYSHQSDNLLLDQIDEIKMYIQSQLHTPAGTWTLSRNCFKTPFASGQLVGELSNRFSVSIPTKDLYPGLYDLRVTLDVGNGDTEESVCVFAWQVDQMKTLNERPADFDAFWAKAKAEIDAVELDPREETALVDYDEDQINDYNINYAALPKSYDPEGITHATVQSQKLSFAGPDGGRVYGYFAKPKASGKFPAMLILPGAGYNARPRPLEHARHGFIALDIQVHGQDVYQDGYRTLQPEENERDYSSPEKHYYYNVHKRVLQALNYLASRDDVDVNKIVVVGGSQGGRLTTVASGIDTRVKAAVPCITHFGYQAYHQWVTSCNENQDKGMSTELPDIERDAKFRCETYYDPMHFAQSITCPVLMNAGLTDPVSKAQEVFGVYNHISSANKHIEALPGIAHEWCAEFDRRAWQWLQQVLNK